jgi:large subunit ribosomal protein L18
MITKKSSNELRLKRHLRIRKKIKGTAERPRLSIFRSNKNIYAQLIDDVAGITLASASSKDESLKANYGGNKDAASAVGKLIAKAGVEKGIKSVVFDRSGYIYHGRVAAVADGAREGGLEF